MNPNIGRKCFYCKYFKYYRQIWKEPTCKKVWDDCGEEVDKCIGPFKKVKEKTHEP